MIDGAERGARAKQDRKLPTRKDVDVQCAAAKRHHQPARALYHKRAFTGIRHVERLRVDANPVNLGSPMRRSGCFETVTLWHDAIVGEATQPCDVPGSSLPVETRLNGLPIFGAEETGESCRKACLAEPGFPTSHS